MEQHIYYEIFDKGIYRKGVSYLKNKDKINFEDSRLVIPSK